MRLPFLALLLALVCATLFALDSVGYFTRVDDPVARLRHSEGAVRRLSSGELSWDYVRTGAEFAERDAIATGEAALAELELRQGGVLEMEPGTMVVLYGDTDELQLNFLTGGGRVRVPTQRRRKIKIRSKPANVVVEEVEKVPPKPRRAPKVVRIRSLIDEASVSKSVPALTTDAIARIEALPDAPLGLLPESGAPVDLAERSLTLSWAMPEGQAAPKGFEVALRAADGSSPAKTFRAGTPHLKVSGLKAGRYLWAVRALSQRGPGKASTYQWFEVTREAKAEPPPKPKPPVPQKRLRVLPVIVR